MHNLPELLARGPVHQVLPPAYLNNSLAREDPEVPLIIGCVRKVVEEKRGCSGLAFETWMWGEGGRGEGMSTYLPFPKYLPSLHNRRATEASSVSPPPPPYPLVVRGFDVFFLGFQLLFS